MAKPAPDLKIPPSKTTVSVRIIDTTSHISGIEVAPFISPAIKGFTHLDCPAYSFLIEHPSGRKLLFDLGVRKDFENLVPALSNVIESNGWKISVKQGVRDQLEEHGVNGSDIEGVIWSHWHWDHIGDPSTFEPHTALIVGPGFKKEFVPGWPANEKCPIKEADYEGRELREIEFDQGLKVGKFKAFDYFGDGSFYLLDSPGHAIGHMCGFARVTTGPNTFILMGADTCHHGGQFRPSQYHPLPDSISPHPFGLKSGSICPGSLFEGLLRDGDNAKPFYEIAMPVDGSAVAYNIDEAKASISKLIEADAQDEVLVVMAHDVSLLDVVNFFPKYANDFREKGWVEKGRWLFLKDFAEAVEK
jgi:glyoxylase-like metal-dependent hydrolase (beta-lactamase superfamily II)